MADILYYLLKVSVGTTVFYITYHFLFRKSKRYVFNRLYLIGSFIVSFIIPMISFKTKTYVTETISLLPANVTAFSETFAFASETGSSMSLYNYLLIIYLLGVVFFISKLLYSCIIAARIKKRCQIEQIKGLNIYVTEDNICAFTFLDKIIIGKNILGHPSLIMILLHESVHSKEKHFYDILTAELLFSLQWFNPFAWLHRNAIRNNLEFRADDIVIRESDAEEYQLTMLSMVQNRIKPPLFAELNSSNLKKRIIMMNRKPSPGTAIFKKIAIIPLIAIAGLALTNSSAHELAYTAQQNQIESTPNGNGSWELVSKADVSDIFFSTGKTIDQLIIGTFKGTKGDYDYAELAITVKIYIDKEGVGSLFARFYKSDGENRELFTKDDATGSFFPAPVKVRFSSGKTIELEQFIIGNIMSDFSNIYTEISRGDLLNLILEKEEKFNVLIDLREIPVSNNKIYRFDIDPAGLKELFAKL